MQKKISLNISALTVIIACCIYPNMHALVSKTITQTPSSTQAYSCGAVYPSEVYCPTGQTCAFPGPTCIMSIIVGGSSITETLYNLNIPAAEFVKITLQPANGTKLPITVYPALGKRVAYQLAPAEGTFAGTPFNIVIQTELPNDTFINTLTRGIERLTDQAQKDVANKLLATLQSYKATGQNINAVYRSVPALGEAGYKLQYVRIPGANAAEAYIMMTPAGNMQFYENSDKAGEKNVFEISTGDLLK